MSEEQKMLDLETPEVRLIVQTRRLRLKGLLLLSTGDRQEAWAPCADVGAEFT